MDAVRASISLPGIFVPFKQGTQLFVDGGLVNPVPVSLCRAMGADIVIAVNLNSELISKQRIMKSSRKNLSAQNIAKTKTVKKGNLLDQLSSYLDSTVKRGKSFIPESFGNSASERGPSIFEVMATSSNIMQDLITRQRLAGDPPDIMISPKLGHIGLLEFNRAEETIREGRRSLDLILPLLRDIIE